MAEPVTARLCWSRLHALPPDVLHAIVRLLSGELRLVQRRARELVNGLVAGARISCHDVIDKLALALHRSFPNLARLSIINLSGAEQLSDASFADFAASTLKQLASLTSLDLSLCRMLGAPTVPTLAGSTPQLQALTLPRSGDGRRWSCDHDQHARCVLLTLSRRPAARAGSIGDAAFQLLPSLSQLTSLSITWGSAVSSGLQHLSGLSALRKLQLSGCHSIWDEHIQALSALTALTALRASSLDITGASLSALASLRTLSVENCRKVAAAGMVSIAQLQQLQQLSLYNGYRKVQRATELAPALPADQPGGAACAKRLDRGARPGAAGPAPPDQLGGVARLCRAVRDGQGRRHA
jgi:hypothetical protein